MVMKSGDGGIIVGTSKIGKLLDLEFLILLQVCPKKFFVFLLIFTIRHGEIDLSVFT